MDLLASELDPKWVPAKVAEQRSRGRAAAQPRRQARTAPRGGRHLPTCFPPPWCGCFDRVGSHRW